jgi:uncharacterized heparinase superfamily protein
MLLMHTSDRHASRQHNSPPDYLGAYQRLVHACGFMNMQAGRLTSSHGTVLEMPTERVN